MVATLEFPGDVLAHINCSYLLPRRRYCEVVGTTGALRVNRAYTPKGVQPDEILHLGEDFAVISTIPLPVQNSYELMARDFMNAILENLDPLYPPEDAIAQMRAMDAIFIAARTGQRVTL